MAEVLQVLLEIVCNLVHEVDSPPSEDIVLAPGVGEVVQLDVLLDALLYEGQAVFPYDGVVNSTLADEKLALQVAGLVNEAGG